MLNFRSVIFSCLALLGGSSAFGQTTAQVLFSDLEKDYSGSNIYPTVITNPAGLSVNLSFKPRASSETVYSTIPPILDLSYTGYIAASPGNNALGDLVTLGGTNRHPESVDVVLVSFAKASSWPALAAQNAAGYNHPVTILLFKPDGTLIAQKSQQVLIPWSPTTLGDGSTYPYGGYAFKVRINFPTDLPLLDSTVAVMVAYNTQTSGFNPIGTAGPYNDLNVALQPRIPIAGTDVDPATMVRYSNKLLTGTTAFGAVAPMFTVRTFPQTPAGGLPVDAGTYITTGTISNPSYQGSTTVDFTIRPLVATLNFTNPLQAVDGTAKNVSITTNPSSVPYTIFYSGRTSPPTAPGSYPFRAVASTANRSGEKTGTLVLVHSFSSWLQTWISNSQLDPSKAGALDDPDGDGIPNLLEYAFDLNPTTVANDGKGRGTLQTENTPTTFSVTFRKRIATDLTFQVQTNTTLNSAGWTSVPGPGAIVTADSSVQNVKVTYNKQSGDERRFFRLLVTKN